MIKIDQRKLGKRRAAQEWVTVTPELAAEILEQAHYEGQRKAHGRHVRYLGDQMDQGKFDPTSQQINIAIHEGSYRLVNGVHRLMAVRDIHKKPVEFPFMYVQADGEHGVAERYSKFDNPQVRKFRDTSSAYKQYERLGTTKSTVGKVGSVVNLLQRKFGTTGEYMRLDHQAVMELVDEWYPFCKPYLDDTAGGELSSKMSNRSTMAIGAITYRYYPIVHTTDKETHAELASEFWSSVATGEMMRQDDPRLRLHQFLLKAKSRGGNNQAGAAFSPLQISLACSRAWNAWQQGNTLNRLSIPKVPDTGYPIMGTGRVVGGGQAAEEE